jgi:hypothetical protein
MKNNLKFTEKYAGRGGRTEKHSISMGTFSKKAVYVAIALCITVVFSCKDDEGDKGEDSPYFQHSDHSYLIVKEKKTWSAASADAAAKGGYLVEINSQEEQNAVYDAIQKSGISTTYVAVPDGGGAACIWIGASDKDNEGEWVWKGSNTKFWSGTGSGSAVDNKYHNWGGKKAGSTNEPDNYGEGQDAAAIGLTKWPAGAADDDALGVAGEWNDIAETNALYYIIEFNEVKK